MRQWETLNWADAYYLMVKRILMDEDEERGKITKEVNLTEDRKNVKASFETSLWRSSSQLFKLHTSRCSLTSTQPFHSQV